ncbi:MAG TPA: hypothetical protein VKT78_16880 [Fimbriimonadaceae bacterium]|nr:hypothetical protein [Fimbriimonadaceae bacterium]
MRTRLLLLLSVCAFAGAAHGQTLYGPGGLIINPTAYTDKKGLFQINASFFNRQLVNSTTTSFYPVSATYALSDRFEFGAIYVGEFTSPTHNDQGGIFIKEGLLTETANRPAVALIGTSLQGGGNFSTATLIGSKEVVRGVRLHLGARAVTFSSDSGLDGNAIAGTDFNVGGPFKVIAEADTRLKHFPYGSQAYGIQYASPGFTTTVGFVAQATQRFSFFVGIGYPVGRP